MSGAQLLRQIRSARRSIPRARGYEPAPAATESPLQILTEDGESLTTETGESLDTEA